MKNPYFINILYFISISVLKKYLIEWQNDIIGEYDWDAISS